MPLNFTGNQLLSLYRVAPFTGAWIETVGKKLIGGATPGRTLHGCVD